ncbi:MAG: ABC transporter ATP-binding protein [PVC group bacterium]|nr:ABC transporter ATP-binding protein [PVC group bacterium]
MILQAVNLHKYYNTRKTKVNVLKGLNIDIVEAEFVTVLGASGAGKSTLLHLLGGLDMPSEGQVLLDGSDFYKIKDRERAYLRSRNIGFVFQFYHLLPEFTALENVMMPGLVGGSITAAEAKQKASQLLEEVGLEHRTSHHPAELSGGEQQRVAIARALMNDPRILLCDEPTGNLDSKTGSKICELLMRLNREKEYTIIIATHSEDIAKLSSRVVHVRDGKIE